MSIPVIESISRHYDKTILFHAMFFFFINLHTWSLTFVDYFFFQYILLLLILVQLYYFSLQWAYFFLILENFKKTFILSSSAEDFSVCFIEIFRCIVYDQMRQMRKSFFIYFPIAHVHLLLISEKHEFL